MKQHPLTFEIARLENATTWMHLRYQATGLPVPHNLDEAVEDFQKEQARHPQNWFIGWLGDEPIALYRFSINDAIVELNTFYVLDSYVETYGPAILSHVVSQARQHGKHLTIDRYPEHYSPLFLKAGFKQNMRTRMLMSLDDYPPQPISLPGGISLRHPQLADEARVIDAVYSNYKGTADEDMVCSSKTQAAGMVQGIFWSEYSRFDLENSFLLEDEQHRLIGHILLGEINALPPETWVWILDISVATAWRGRGVGKSLFTSGLNAAKEYGYTHAGLMVTLNNYHALALYRSFGMKEVGALMYEAVLHFDRL